MPTREDTLEKYANKDKRVLKIDDMIKEDYFHIFLSYMKLMLRYFCLKK